MATEAAATETLREEARGVGGKLKRQSAKRHVTTPYSRPLNQVQRRPWISRIVDPAYRIISGGATRMLPYFFSKTVFATAITAPDYQDQHQDELQNGQQNNDTSITPSSNKTESASSEERGTSSTATSNEKNFQISANTRDKTAVEDVVSISELERLMEGNPLSREATDRLIEIIKSKTADLPEVNRDEKKIKFPLREGAKKNISFLDMRKEPIGGKDANSELWATRTPLTKSIIRDEAGLSPAELAKAYMGGQTSSGSPQGFVARNGNDGLDGGMLVGKPSFASPSSKPSACWPGIKLSEQSGFATPQSRRESFGLQNLPRTPYSRTILSNSKSKPMQLQDGSSKRLSILQSPSQSVKARYGQLKLSKEKDDGLFGPNRRFRRSTTTSLVSPYSRPSSGTSRFGNSAIKKNSEAGESSNLSKSQTTTTYGKQKGSEVSTPTVHPHSSQIARTILDHLERTQPTPKTKSAELKLATSWRYPQSSKTNEQSSLNVNNGEKDSSGKSNEDIQNIFSRNPSSAVLKPSTTDTQSGMTKTASTSKGIFGATNAASKSDTTFQFQLEKPKDSLSRNTHEELITSSQDTTKAVPFSFKGEPTNLPKPQSQSPGNHKPVLPSISITKPFQSWTVPSDSTASFTFPVSSADGTLSSEPTTPSIMPFTTNPPPSYGLAITKDSEIPQFSFNREEGDKSPLVFSFPSVNDEDDEKLGLKFKFGSEKVERKSFSLVGNDGVCC